MALVNIPHFDLPFSLNANDKHANIVEQSSEDDILNCVEAILRTYKGTRYYVERFGVEDPTFQLAPIRLREMQADIIANEPRADVILSTEIDMIDNLISRITVGTDTSGQ